MHYHDLLGLIATVSGLVTAIARLIKVYKRKRT